MPRRSLELALDYRCNLRCTGCKACHDHGERLSAERAAFEMRRALDAGARAVWFGGGEPTLRDDLLALVRRARALGYEEIVVQTNGLRLAYAAYAAALVEAGVTQVRLNTKHHRADVHDRLSGLEGAHALLVRALANLAPRVEAARIVGDVLLARSNAHDLPETIDFFADRGVGGFALWVLSAADDAEDDVTREVPRITEILPALERAAARAKDRGVDLLSFHTPPCTLPPALRPIWQPTTDLSMTVLDAGGSAFPLESSPFEGGAPVEACASCAARARCSGPRADYRRLHGDGEFRALTELAP